MWTGTRILREEQKPQHHPEDKPRWARLTQEFCPQVKDRQSISDLRLLTLPGGSPETEASTLIALSSVSVHRLSWAHPQLQRFLEPPVPMPCGVRLVLSFFLKVES